MKNQENRGIMSSMATIHITRAEAVRDIERLLDQAAGGEDILVESETGGPVLIQGSSLSMDPNDPDFEAWLLSEEAEGLREADDPDTVWIPNDVVEAESHTLNADLLARVEAERKAKAS